MSIIGCVFLSTSKYRSIRLGHTQIRMALKTKQILLLSLTNLQSFIKIGAMVHKLSLTKLTNTHTETNYLKNGEVQI